MKLHLLTITALCGFQIEKSDMGPIWVAFLGRGRHATASLRTQSVPTHAEDCDEQCLSATTRMRRRSTSNACLSRLVARPPHLSHHGAGPVGPSSRPTTLHSFDRVRHLPRTGEGECRAELEVLGIGLMLLMHEDMLLEISCCAPRRHWGRSRSRSKYCQTEMKTPTTLTSRGTELLAQVVSQNSDCRKCVF